MPITKEGRILHGKLVAYAYNQLWKAGYVAAKHVSTKGVDVDVAAFKRTNGKKIKIAVECMVHPHKSDIEKAIKRLAPYFDRIIFVVPKPAYQSDTEDVIIWRAPVKIFIKGKKLMEKLRGDASSLKGRPAYTPR